MITQIIRKLFFCVADVRAIGKLFPKTINVCNWRVHRKYLMKAPIFTKEIPARVPCVTDVLCN